MIFTQKYVTVTCYVPVFHNATLCTRHLSMQNYSFKSSLQFLETKLILINARNCLKNLCHFRFLFRRGIFLNLFSQTTNVSNFLRFKNEKHAGGVLRISPKYGNFRYFIQCLDYLSGYAGRSYMYIANDIFGQARIPEQYFYKFIFLIHYEKRKISVIFKIKIVITMLKKDF